VRFIVAISTTTEGKMRVVEPSRGRKTPFGDADAPSQGRHSPFDLTEHLRAADAGPIHTGYEVFSLQHAFDGLDERPRAETWGRLYGDGLETPARSPQSLFRIARRLSSTLARLAIGARSSPRR
jgi:hypothetical protein